jgi:3',5'-cyclic AMP phosphodiesterase CpdA
MSVRFVFLTDTHYHPCAPKDFGAPKMLTRGREVLDITAAAVNALKPDFIVHGGDLLCGGGSFEMPRETYLQSIEHVAQAYSGFDAPAYYVPGNHDCDADTRSLDAFASRFPVPDLLNVAEAAPGLRLALANIYAPASPDYGGVWTNEHDEILRQAGRDALTDRCALILVIHEWVVPADGDTAGKGVVGNAAALMRTLSELPAMAAVFTGHRHTNRIRLHGGFAVVDTACLIGFPLGFRELTLSPEGLMSSRFHQLDLPDLIRASYDRSSPEVNAGWQGEVGDRDTDLLLPGLREMWS